MRVRRSWRSAIGLILANVVLAGAVPFAGLGPIVLGAPGDGWSNDDGTSTTTTGQASTAEPARVFAFDVGVPVISCTSDDGRCAIGIPDGPTSFEIFTNPGTTTVTFKVVTASPITCTRTVTFKASFDGQTYVAQPTLPNDNHCAPNACPVSGVTGYFEPVQAVFQDDPLDAGNHFADRPGARLTRTSPTFLIAELPMAQGKPALLYGVDHTTSEAPKDRGHIVIKGVTTGTVAVPVAMHFSGSDGVELLYTTPVLGQIFLDGPCGPPQPFEMKVDATDGIWPRSFPPFQFNKAGPYTITSELRRKEGGETGIKVTVAGTVVATSMPPVAFIPMVLDPFSSPAGLPAAAARLNAELVKFIPDFFPIRPGSLKGTVGTLVDARARTRAARASWGTWLSQTFGQSTDDDTLKQVVAASLADWMTTASMLGNVGRSFIVLSDADIELLRRSSGSKWDGYALTQKVILLQHSVSYTVAAHELVHTMPYPWLDNEMTAQCGVNYHNLPNGLTIAHGVAITEGGVESRRQRPTAPSIMAHNSGQDIWIDQCTYANLVNVLQTPPDPAVILVRGRLAQRGGKVAGDLFPAYELQGTSDLAAGAGGDWAIVARSAAGQELGRFPFEPLWDPPDVGVPSTVLSFGHRIPALVGLARLDLVGPGGALLDSIVLTSHRPSVTIGSPATNRVARPSAGKVRVSWQARDTDGDALHATVLYSSDGGVTYLPQAVEVAASSFEVTLGPGITHRVKVVVTDGGRSASTMTVFSSETPAELVARIASAYRAGKASGLLARLDPAVIARYGTGQCAAFLKTVKLPGLTWTVRSQSGPAAWTWTTDGRSTRIAATWTLAVDQRYQGATTRLAIHIAIRDGRLSYFADCGRPV